MFVLGMDIGYSNLKLTFGNHDSKPNTTINPAGAAPVDRLPGSLKPGHNPVGFRVQVNGQSWATGIHPSRFEVWERSLHPDYATTDSYQALFYTALALCGKDEIDLLVTGLPSSQFEELRNKVKQRMYGVHQIAARRSVHVKEVKVVPQPVGGFIAALADINEDDADLLAEGRVLVLDPGHFSFDWVLISESELQKRSSGSSMEAMSALLEDAAVKIGEDFGGRLEADRIEQALQAGKDYVLLHGRKIKVSQYLEQASQTVSAVAVEKMRTSLRKLGGDIDAVVVIGGGANWWMPIAKKLYPKSKVIVPNDPVLANARGFFEIGAANVKE